ncbi:MAG TPA: MFS transporter [Anaerolineales bacterium]|nr:MFS transporter [Anaerolineales bacterium]
MNNRYLFSIILVVFIDLLGFSLIIPLLPYYAETFNASDTTIGLLLASYAAAQLIGAPLLGRASDRYGRRPILLISIFGTFLGFLLFGFAESLAMLFASRILQGLTGGNLSVAQAYITDVTDARSRNRGLGMIGAAFGLGFIIGPALGGLLSNISYHVPAFVAAALSFVNLLLIAFWLPESLTPERRAQLTQKKPVFSFDALLQALKHPLTGPLLITRFLYSLAFVILQSIFSLFALRRFNMSVVATGFVLTYVGVVSVITQAWLVGKLSQRFRDTALIQGGLLGLGLGLLLWAFAPSVPMLVFSTTPVALAGGLLNTVLPSALTKTVEPQEVGGILGLSTSVESSTRVIAPLLGGFLLENISYWAPGMFGALLLFMTFAYVLRTIKHDGEVIRAA